MRQQIPKSFASYVLRCMPWLVLFAFPGCSLLPELSRQPTFHNPFPQLSKVAIAPFFNLSNEPTVDGRKVANDYYNELQLIPGFEVVPVNVVEAAMREYHIDLHGPSDARRLAQVLDVDAVLVGAVTDYIPYYPPRLSMQVEWYAANPAFHPIPPGYGLPWGSKEEQDIPGPLVFEAEMSLAKAQLQTQTPAYQKLPIEIPQVENSSTKNTREPALHGKPEVSGPQAPPDWSDPMSKRGVKPAQFTQAVPPANAEPVPTDYPPGYAPPGFPPDWPDPRGFIPTPPTTRPPTCWPNDAPVIRHTKTYNGHDADFTEALSSYYYFRDDARFGGWQSYLERSDDFVRFCCHMHVAETLTARGGGGEMRVVWRWPIIR